MSEVYMSVSYGKGGKFDLHYFINHHMPLVERIWGPFGFKGWTIVEFTEDPKYAVSVQLIWESMEMATAAFAHPDSKELVADDPNYTDQIPETSIGKIVAASS